MVEMGLMRVAPLLAPVGQAFAANRDKAADALSNLKDAVTSGAANLSSVTSSRLEAAMNSVSQHLTDSDIGGAIKQAVTGVEHGGDHLQEVENAGESLQNLSSSLSGALNNPNLPDATRTLFNNTLNAIKPVIQNIKDLQK